jgi:hypothetical protein
MDYGEEAKTKPTPSQQGILESIEPMDILWHEKTTKHDRCPECHGSLAMVSTKVRSCGACQVDWVRGVE